MLKADIKGWQRLAQGPDRGRPAGRRRTTARTSASTSSEQTLESKAQNKLILDRPTPRPTASSPITDTLLEETIATLALGGIDITADKLFDLSVLDEVYEENPDLKADAEP